MTPWKHKIKIKHLFTDDTTPELIITLCDELVRQLTPIKNKYESSDGEDDNFIYYELEDIIDNFLFLKELATNKIVESEWDEYSFDGDFESLFNEYLGSLYDLADYKKLIWIR